MRKPTLLQLELPFLYVGRFVRRILFRHIRQLADRVHGIVGAEVGVAPGNHFTVMAHDHLSECIART